MSNFSDQNSSHQDRNASRNQPDADLARTFRFRLERAFHNSKWDSWRQVARASNCSPAMLTSIVRGDFDTSRLGPGTFGAYRMARTLGVTLDDLAPPTKAPSATQFLSIYSGPSTPIGNFGPMLAYCDVYDEPRDGLTFLHRLGPRSLLSKESGIKDPEILQLEYERWSHARKRKIYNRQRRAWDGGQLSELEFFADRFTHNDKDVRAKFLLAACRVLDLNNTPRLLIFCDPIPHEH